jgi:ketosteroid isomerase-like protein
MVAVHADAARTEVMAVLDRRVEASRARDIDRLMSLYAPGIVYFDIIPPHRFTGTDAVRRNFLRWFAEYRGDIGLETHELSIAVGDDVAFAHMLHPDSGTRRSGQDVTVWVRASVCLQRIDDRWLITHEHVSFPIDPAQWSAVVDRATREE